MNILDPGFSPQEAKVRYLDADYVVTSPGSFVRCAITGKPISIEDLKYWNVDRQEAYIDADAAYKAYLQTG
jgi:hypothetical protein